MLQKICSILVLCALIVSYLAFAGATDYCGAEAGCEDPYYDIECNAWGSDIQCASIDYCIIYWIIEVYCVGEEEDYDSMYCIF